MDPVTAYTQALAELTKLLSQALLRASLDAHRSVPTSPDLSPLELRQARIDAILRAVLPELEQSTQAAYDVATDFIEAEAVNQGTQRPEIPRPTSYVREDTLRKRVTISYSDNAEEMAQRVRAQLAPSVQKAAARVIVSTSHGSLEDLPDDLLERLDNGEPIEQLKETALADTSELVDAKTGEPVDGVPPGAFVHEGKVYRHPIGYARKIQGEYTCGFCIMMASRGPIYSSYSAAKYKWKTGPVKWRKYMNESQKNIYRETHQEAFHTGCDCAVVPVFTSAAWPGKEQYDAAKYIYEKATENYDSVSAWEAVELIEMLVGEDAPDNQAVGALKGEIDWRDLDLAPPSLPDQK